MVPCTSHLQVPEPHPCTVRRSPLSDLKTVKSGPTGSRKREQKSQPPRPPSRVGADAKGWLGIGLRYNTVKQSFLPSGAGGASWRLTIHASHHPHATAQPLCRQASRQAGQGPPRAAFLPAGTSLTSEDNVLKHSNM